MRFFTPAPEVVIADIPIPDFHKTEEDKKKNKKEDKEKDDNEDSEGAGAHACEELEE